jgi:hypothetical protein
VIERSYYVETSVWGMIPKGQPREMRRATLRFLRQVPREWCFVSEAVLEEINACQEPVRTSILRMYSDIEPAYLHLTDEVRELAEFYIGSGILPAKKKQDALHVAIATVKELDALVSWNHRHMVNLRKTEQYREANLVRGYWKTPQILTPLEVLHERSEGN